MNRAQALEFSAKQIQGKRDMKRAREKLLRDAVTMELMREVKAMKRGKKCR